MLLIDDLLLWLPIRGFKGVLAELRQAAEKEKRTSELKKLRTQEESGSSKEVSHKHNNKYGQKKKK
jgi:hypothetical protein